MKVRIQRGPFQPGDQVQLTDPKGRMHQIVLQPGGTYHTHRGSLSHDDLIGKPEGSVVTAAGGTAYVALRPLLADYTLAMKRGATIVYPKDAAMILGYADIFPGARVLEAGAGSGALSAWMLRATGPTGLLVSFEARADFAEIARANVRKYFGEVPAWWRLAVGELSAKAALESAAGTDAAPSATVRNRLIAGAPGNAKAPAGEPAGAGTADVGTAGVGTAHAGPADAVIDDIDSADAQTAAGSPGAAALFDRVVLDMLAPWDCVADAATALIAGGLICCYVATTTQLSRTVEELRAHGGFFEPAAWETMYRSWHVDGLAVRPDHRMIGHTGFLVTARRLADGVTTPPRRRRPAKGAHPEEADAAQAPEVT